MYAGKFNLSLAYSRSLASLHYLSTVVPLSFVSLSWLSSWITPAVSSWSTPAVSSLSSTILHHCCGSASRSSSFLPFFLIHSLWGKRALWCPSLNLVVSAPLFFAQPYNLLHFKETRLGLEVWWNCVNAMRHPFCLWNI